LAAGLDNSVLATIASQLDQLDACANVTMTAAGMDYAVTLTPVEGAGSGQVRSWTLLPPWSSNPGACPADAWSRVESQGSGPVRYRCTFGATRRTTSSAVAEASGSSRTT
jgi:hypothetical protein